MSNIKTNFEAFANWIILTDEQKKQLNLPPNLTQYAKLHGISDRQLRRWKKDPTFLAIVDKKKARINHGLSAIDSDGNQAELEGDSSGGTSGEIEDDYTTIKSTLIKGAMSGDPKYLDLYFKTYGKDFVAEESAARTSDLAGLEMEELILQSLEALDINKILSFVETMGYKIEKTSEESI